MPRNRKQRSPTEAEHVRVKARLDPLPNEGRHLARCGRCGQFLWAVDDGYTLGPSRLKDLKIGWRFDQVGRIWRPTETHLAQRRAVGARIRAGVATAKDRASLRHDDFGRRRTRSADGESVMVRYGRFVPFGNAADLPMAIQCARCGAENDVEDPVAASA